MAKLGEDVTEVLDYVPGHFQVIRHVRPKYACTACDSITQAPAPAMPTPRGRATPATLAHLLVQHLVDGTSTCPSAKSLTRIGVATPYHWNHWRLLHCQSLKLRPDAATSA
jgi:transposase